MDRAFTDAAIGVADCDTREGPTRVGPRAGTSASATGEGVVALGQVPRARGTGQAGFELRHRACGDPQFASLPAAGRRDTRFTAGVASARAPEIRSR